MNSTSEKLGSGHLAVTIFKPDDFQFIEATLNLLGAIEFELYPFGMMESIFNHLDAEESTLTTEPANT